MATSPDGTRWALGHAIGASLVDAATGAAEHFHSLRWLPAEEVRDLTFAADGSLWVATSGGLVHLLKEPTTLSAKAEVMLSQLDAWRWRLGGFVSPAVHQVDPWKPAGGAGLLVDDDNDGQWTEEAVGAFCYAYATTHEERYYAAARKAVENMFLLFDVPAADFEAAGLGFGFMARSVVRDDEGAIFASKATQSNWHLVHHTDGHDYYWKDDTSSDEVTGHIFGLALFHDLCAQDDTERAEVSHYLSGMVGTILDHGYHLVDVDGEKTTHGRCGPEDLAIAVDGLDVCCEGRSLDDCIDKCADAWGGGGFLNALEILAGLLAAWHTTGEPRLLEAYETLVGEHRYDEVATFVDTVMTWTQPSMANYCDHELADLAFIVLLRYEPDPARRALWAKSIVDAFAYEVGERNPLKSLSMAVALAEVPGLDAGVRTLREYPTDLRDLFVDNAHRLDATPKGKDRHGDPQLSLAFPYDELFVMRWDGNPYATAQGGDGTSRLAPTFWLLPYWGLRYHGALCAD